MRLTPTRNPRDGQFDYTSSVYDTDDVRPIAETLYQEQKLWRSLEIESRSEGLQQLHNALVAHRKPILDAIIVDTGRIATSHIEFNSVLGLLDYWISVAEHFPGSLGPRKSALVSTVEYSHTLIPYRVVGVISPWNFPLLLSLIDSIPALLAGCSVIVKPSEITPRFIEPLSEAIASVEGVGKVLKYIGGDGITGAALIEHVEAVCFTGSVVTGRRVAVQAAKALKPAFLELGGKDPAIVLPSANLKNAAQAILRSALGMTGQSCQSIERVYVHESVAGEFTSVIMEETQNIKINWPNPHAGHIGPIILERQALKIRTQLHDAVARGAQVLCGGDIEEHGGGLWMTPTIMTGVDHTFPIMQEETFGPIIPIMTYSTTEEAIQLANDSEYGLSAAVFGSDISQAHYVARQLEVGAISLNDAGLTSIAYDVEKNSFMQSGLGGSRMGLSGITRFLRKRALIQQNTSPLSLEALNEKNFV